MIDEAADAFVREPRDDDPREEGARAGFGRSAASPDNTVFFEQIGHSAVKRL